MADILLADIVREPVVYGIDIVDDPIMLGEVARSHVVYGIRFTPDDTLFAADSDISLDLVAVEDTDTVLATLDLSYGREFTDIASDSGSGSFRVALDDLSSYADLDLDRKLVNFYVRGQLAWTMMLETDTFVQVDPDREDENEGSTVNGRGHLALWEEAIVHPALGTGSQPAEDDRTFDWTEPGFDDSAWPLAKMITFHLFASVGLLGLPPSWPIPWSLDYPDQRAWILWGSSGDQFTAPIGDIYLREKDVLIGFSGQVALFMLADNYAEFYVDGVLVMTVNGFAEGRPVELFTITAGFHTFAIKATNLGGPGGVEATLYIPGYPPTLLWHTGGDPVDVYGAGFGINVGNKMKVLQYPANPPAMTIGQVILTALAEAQARGILTYMDVTFTELTDSSGDPWEYAAISTKIGTDYFQFLKEIANTYADIAMVPGQTLLQAWNKDTRGALVALEFHPVNADPDLEDQTQGNVTSLVRTRVRPGATYLLLRWQGGWNPIGTGPTEAMLTLGALLDLAQVYAVGQQQLDIFSVTAEQIELAFDPRNSGETPYFAFLVGDRTQVVTADGLSTAEQRVFQIGVVEDDETGEVTYTVKLRDRVLEFQDRIQQWIKKLSNGALGGRSQPTQPVVPQPPKVRGVSAALLAGGAAEISDNFNKDDSAILGPGIFWASNWAAHAFGPDFVGVHDDAFYMAESSSPFGAQFGLLAIAQTRLSSSQMFVQATCMQSGVLGPSLYARLQDGVIGSTPFFSGLAGYVLTAQRGTVNGNPAFWSIARIDLGGTVTVLDSGTEEGTIYRIECEGTTIRALIDTVEVGSASDATYSSGHTAVGLGSNASGFLGAPGSPLWDDFSAGVLGGVT